MSEQLATLTTNWIGDFPNQNWYTPIPIYNNYCYTYTPSRIRLTMSEIEKLRKIAKNNKDIQEILAKFTDSIEVVVDFK